MASYLYMFQARVRCSGPLSSTCLAIPSRSLPLRLPLALTLPLTLRLPLALTLPLPLTLLRPAPPTSFPLPHQLVEAMEMMVRIGRLAIGPTSPRHWTPLHYLDVNPAVDRNTGAGLVLPHIRMFPGRGYTVAMLFRLDDVSAGPSTPLCSFTAREGGHGISILVEDVSAGAGVPGGPRIVVRVHAGAAGGQKIQQAVCPPSPALTFGRWVFLSVSHVSKVR